MSARPLATSLVSALLLCWALSPARSLAEELFVETAAYTKRTDAEAARAAVLVEGLETELVRRFRRGYGWEYLLRAGGFELRDAAHEAAQRLAGASGQAVQVYLLAGRDRLPVDELAVPGRDPTRVREPGDISGSEDPDAAEQPGAGKEHLAALLRAHGGGSSTAEVGQGSDPSWDRVHFRFERSLPLEDGMLRAWHDYWRQGELLRLEVRILEGEGRDSVTVLGADEQAWLAVDGQVHAVSFGPTREALQSFAPEQVLDQALAFRGWPLELQASLTSSHEAGLSWLALSEDPINDASLVGFDEGDHRIRELRFAGTEGRHVCRFGDYQEPSLGLVIPGRLETWYGEALRERVAVRALEFPETMDAALFDGEALKAAIEAP